MKNKGNLLIFLVLTLILISKSQVAFAAPGDSLIPIPDISVTVDGETGSPKDLVNDLQLLLILTALGLLPSILLTMTAFTRIAITLGFVKSAIGAQNAIPSQVLVGLALFLTLFVMTPTISKINEEAVQPYINEEISQSEAIEIGTSNIKEFMIANLKEKDLKLFMDIKGIELEDKGSSIENARQAPMDVVIPAYIISELKAGFTMGFFIYLPFLIIDFVVGSVLMSMGMMMIPPAMIALPFKLLLFVMVDGWDLVVQAILKSFNT